MSDLAATPLRLLLIEDRTDDAEGLLRELRKAGYVADAERVDTPEALAQALGKGPWDLVLCDNAMPSFSGAQALGLVKRTDPGITFIFISGSPVRQDGPEGWIPGESADGFLEKGDRGALLTAVKAVISRKVPPPRKRELASGPWRSRPSSASAPQPKALLVDDRTENLTALEAILGGLGAELVRASSGEEALGRLLREDFAVILLDVRMPGIGGLETAQLLRKRHRTRSVPIIFLTASPEDPGEVVHGYEAGCVDYITKPFIAEVLRAKVSVFLELWRKGETVERQATELRSNNEDLQAFSASAAHDLRAPLRSISSFAQILSEDYAGKVLDQEGQGFANRIRQAAERMDALIRDLLTFARVERGDLDLGTVDLTGLVDDVLSGMKDEIQRLGARLAVLRPLGPVKGHAPVLRQVIENLVSNALKFTRAGEPPDITIRAEDRGQGLRFWIEDKGLGIDRKDHERLFRPFGRMESAATYPGTGLGLAIAKRALERMGGKIGVESEAGLGTRFWVEIAKP